MDLRLLFQPVLPGMAAPVLTERVVGSSGATVRTPELASLARWLADRPEAGVPDAGLH